MGSSSKYGHLTIQDPPKAPLETVYFIWKNIQFFSHVPHTELTFLRINLKPLTRKNMFYL